MIIEYAGKLPSPQCEIFFGHIAGAANRIAPDATAYTHRDAKFVLNVHGRWESTADDRVHRLGTRFFQSKRALCFRRRLR